MIKLKWWPKNSKALLQKKIYIYSVIKMTNRGLLKTVFPLLVALKIKSTIIFTSYILTINFGLVFYVYKNKPAAQDAGADPS